MIYGCIGEHQPPAILRELHGRVGGYAYEAREIALRDLEAFMRARPFQGVNVTGACARAVIPCLDQVSEAAAAIGAVDTVVQRDGRLFGDNTGFAGLCALLARLKLDLRGKKVLVLGAGDMRRTALYTAQALVAGQALVADSLAEAARAHADAEIIINAARGGETRPEETPVSLEPFRRLEGVVDTAYSPLRSPLVLAARARGVPAEGGLYMLAVRVVRAAELFQNAKYPETLAAELCREMLGERENIVLIGMPGSGKSTLAAVLGERLSRPVADVDALVTARAGMTIPEIFARFGEPRFRALETEVVREIAARDGQVIATGGGTVLRPENVAALRQNGRLFFLYRPLEALLPSPDRPLGDTREKIARLFQERMPIYRAAADETVIAGDAPEITAREIESRQTGARRPREGTDA